jgi:hypothetical protein
MKWNKVQNLIKENRNIEAVFSEIENLVLESKHELKDRLKLNQKNKPKLLGSS